MCGHSVWKQPAYNGKNPPTYIFYNLKKVIRIRAVKTNLNLEYLSNLK